MKLFQPKSNNVCTARNGLARSRVALTLALAVSSASVQLLFADEFPAGCSKANGGQGNTSTTGINFATHQAHVGDTVQVLPTLGMVAGACQTEHATGSVYIASGLLVIFLNNVTLNPGFVYQCPTNTSPPCSPGPYNVTIVPALVGAGVTSPSGSAAGVPKTVRALQWSFSSNVRVGVPEETMDKLDTASISIVTPCIQVQKFCDLPAGKACFGANDAIKFRGFVTNCGDITLTNVTAIDSRIGPLALLNPVTGAPLNIINPTGPVTLAAGAFATFTNSYTPTQQEICAGNATNAVTVRGTDTSDIGGPRASVTNSATAICPICINPCIAVTKNCNPPVVQAGATVTFSGVVTNCGDITLTNVTLTDTFLGRVIAIIPVLPAGASQAYSTNYVTTTSDCTLGTLTNTVIAVARDNCNTRNVTDTARCAFLVQCPACDLSVTKTACVVTNPPKPCPCVLGYPFVSDNPRTSVIFNESEVLRAFAPNVAGPADTLKVWYNDEHALTLGVRRVLVKTTAGTTTNDYPVTPLNAVPGSAFNPDVGTTLLSGDQAGTDLSERPMWPALFITDITNDPNSRSNDWQYGGTPIAPNAVFGTWKGAVRTVDRTVNPPKVTVTPDPDPAKNDWNLGGGDPVPFGTPNEGYGAEVRWDVADLMAAGIMQMGHVYRVQFMVHDGDQNKVGGDVGENCAIVALGAGVACTQPPPVVAECTGGAIAITLEYTGTSINAPTTVTVKGSGTAPVVYNLPSLNTGDILTLPSQNGFTIDATALGASKLGAQTFVYINSSYEVLHTSCSCTAYPTNNLMVCHPQCLDASSPDNAAGVKGPGSPLWTLMALKDPNLGIITCPSLTTTNNGQSTNIINACANVLPPLPTNNVCSGKIHELLLGYLGGGCAAMQHSQASGKVICTNSLSASNASPVRIRVTDPPGGHVFLDTGFPASVNLGDIVEVLAGFKADATFPADLVITIYDGANVLIESVRIKADCSQPVKLGDIYGGLQVVQMTSQNGGTVVFGAQVNYTYVIQNNGGVALTNVTVIDDLLGPVPGSPIPVLQPGQSVTLMQSALISSSTTNTVTVSGYQGVIQCSATGSAFVVRAPAPCPCVLGYPFASDNPRTSVIFNESQVLRGFAPNVAGPADTLKVWYNDEHALTLGVRRVIVKTAGGTTTNDYPVTPLNAVPGSAFNPDVGTTLLSGDQAGTDLSERPMWPALFITDITNDPNNRSNDWQYGGTPIAPNAVFGTWKGAVRTVDRTVNPPKVTVTPDPDPAKNDWNLGGGDPVPFGTPNEGYGAEARWNVADLMAAGIMQMGHVYRVQFMVHDGDQNKVGGDVGQNCATVALGIQPECPQTPPATNRECSSGIVAFLVKYTGPNMPAGTTVTFRGSSSATVLANYSFPGGLTNGTVLTLPFENDPGRAWTIDATKHGATKLGTTTSVYFNNVLTEVLHTSCSCRINNFIPGQPACLDASSPDNPTGVKGEPSPLFLVLDFK